MSDAAGAVVDELRQLVFYERPEPMMQADCRQARVTGALESGEQSGADFLFRQQRRLPKALLNARAVDEMQIHDAHFGHCAKHAPEHFRSR